MNTISTFLHFETWPSRPSNFLINEERESLLWTFPKFCNYCLDSFCHGGSHIGKDSWLELCGNLISALHASKHLPRQHVSSSTPWYRMFGTHQYDAALLKSPKCTFSFLGMLGASSMMTENLYIPRSWIGKSLFAEESGKGSQVQRIRMSRFALALTTHQYNPESTTAATSF